MRRAWLMSAAMVLVAGGLVGLADGVANAATSTFTSTQVGTTGSTAPFSMTGSWAMAWSFNCSNYGYAGVFSVTIAQPTGDITFDLGPNESGMSGSGTDHYFDAGTFHLSVISECQWSITVRPTGASPVGAPVTITSSDVGSTGSTEQFSVAAPWTMAWDYSCSSYGHTGVFIVTIEQPTGDLTVDLGPNESGMSGSGTDQYYDSGTFHLSVISECQWSITVSGTGTPPPPPSAPSPIVGMAGMPTGTGYWTVASNGKVTAHGSAPSYGGATGFTLNDPIVGIAPSENSKGQVNGYWLDASDGGIFAFGTAPFYGSMGGKPLNQPMVSMAPTPDGHGYWTVASDGGIFSFGDAQFYGSMGGKPLNKPVVGMAVDSATGGYWLVATDGGIFSFNAPFYGSMGGQPLNEPIIEMESAPQGGGYRFVAKDGGVFCFNLSYEGSLPGDGIDVADVAGMAASGATGYWVAEADGVVHSFGAAPTIG